MARVANKPARQGRKREEREPKSQKEHYTDLMDIEGEHGKKDYISYLIGLTMDMGTVPRNWDEWDKTAAHGSEITDHGNVSTRGTQKNLKGGADWDIILDNGLIMYMSIYNTRDNMSPTARAQGEKTQLRVQNFSGSLQRVESRPPPAQRRKRASGTTGHSPTVIELEKSQGKSKDHAVTRNVCAQGERDCTHEARILIDTFGIDLSHRIGHAINFITIGRQDIDHRRVAQLRRDTKWPRAAQL